MTDPRRFSPKRGNDNDEVNIHKDIMLDDWEDYDPGVPGKDQMLGAQDDPLAKNETRADRINYLQAEAGKFDNPRTTADSRERDYFRHKKLKRERSEFFLRQAENAANKKRSRGEKKYKKLS